MTFKRLILSLILPGASLMMACNTARPVCELSGNVIQTVNSDRTVDEVAVVGGPVPVAQLSDGSCIIPGSQSNSQDQRLLAQRILENGGTFDGSLDDLPDTLIDDLRSLSSIPDFDEMTDAELLVIAQDCDAGIASPAICSALVVYLDSLE